MAERCETCYYWRPDSATSSKGECEKTGKYVKYNDCCEKYVK